MAQPIAIERVDHIGIRVRDLDRALAFYSAFGFALVRRAEGDDVAIVRNEQGVELNLVFNANAGDPAANILTDVPQKFAGYTHMALRVALIPATIAGLNRLGSRSPKGQSALAKLATYRGSCAIPTATSSNCAAASKAMLKA